MRTVLVWDREGPPPAGDWTIVLWRAFAPAGQDGMLSLPALVEEHAGDLRRRFLAWIYDLGQAVVAGRRVVDHLQLRPGFSYWWMTTLSHTPNYYEAPRITDALKCLALEDLCRELPVAELRLETGDAALAQVIEAFCSTGRIRFEKSGTPSAAVSRGAPRPAGRPESLVATMWRQLTGLARARPHRPSAGGAITFFDLLLYLEPGSARDGRFRSRYWGALVRALEASKHRATWVHIFYPHGDSARPQDAEALLERFNRAEPRTHHLLLDGALTPGAFAAAARLFAKLVRAALHLRDVSQHFAPAGSNFNFWPFFRRNWYASLVGPAALRSCQRLVLYSTLLRSMPKQSIGVFIQENQPWEMALIHAWRESGHGQLVGVPHTTVRFWDLRYFYDPRTYAESRPGSLPMPDVVAVNGPMALRAYRDGGYPAERLREVEALRFGHLGAALASRRSDAHVDQQARPRRVLICGDNIPGSNRKVMGVVEAAAALLPPDTAFTFKPHQAGHFDPAEFPRLHLDVRTDPLDVLLDHCDLAVTGNVTSAAADAYCRRVRVAVFLDPESLNGSPLRGVAGVSHFRSAEELAAIVTSMMGPPEPEPLFCLDPDLTRWRSLLKLSEDGRAA